VGGATTTPTSDEANGGCDRGGQSTGLTSANEIEHCDDDHQADAEEPCHPREPERRVHPALDHLRKPLCSDPGRSRERGPSLRLGEVPAVSELVSHSQVPPDIGIRQGFQRLACYADKHEHDQTHRESSDQER